MTAQSEKKHAVLKGVYEDNLGLPRSFNGKRSVPGHSAAAGRGRHAGWDSFGRGSKTRLIGLVALIALLGCNFRIGHVDSFGAEFRRVAELAGSQPLATAAVQYPSFGVMPEPRLVLASDFAEGHAPDAGVDITEQYNAMLSHLGMPVADLFNLKVQTIVIDPGHGGYDPGATGHGGLKEKDVTLAIARRLRRNLESTGSYRVLLTRDDDIKMRLKERVNFARENDADLFISLHINSVPEEAGSVNYVETYYFGPHTDDRSLALATAENHDSDYAMGDFRAIITRIGDTLKTEESAKLATTIHTQLYSNLRRVSSGIMDAGAKTGPFVVLLGVDVPSVLVEISCISNRAEESRLGTPEYRDRVAEYLELGIVEYLQRRAIRGKQDGVNTQYVAQQER